MEVFTRHSMVMLALIMLQTLIFEPAWSSPVSGQDVIPESERTSPGATDVESDNSVINPNYSNDNSMVNDPRLGTEKTQKDFQEAKSRVIERCKREKENLLTEYNTDLDKINEKRFIALEGAAEQIDETYSKIDDLEKQQAAELSDAQSTADKRAIKKKYKSQIKPLVEARKNEKKAMRDDIKSAYKTAQTVRQQQYFIEKTINHIQCRKDLKTTTPTEEYKAVSSETDI